MTKTMSGCRSTVLSVVSAVFCAACASAGGGAAAHPVHASVHVEPPVTSQPTTTATAGSGAATANASTTAAPAAPELMAPQTSRQPALVPAPERRIRELDVPPGTPIATAVAQIAAQTGLAIMIDPAVHGTTSAHLRNVTIDEALRQLVASSGATFQVQGSVLRVIPIRMETRTFHLDYVALSRVGTMSTIVQRRLSNNTAGYTPQVGATAGMGALGVANAAAASGGDVLSAQSVADIWQEIRVALIGILQAGQPVAHVTTQAGPGEQANGAAATLPGGGGFSSGAASIPFPDGSSLVISPISGLINVTAMPDRLAAADAFINDFQASVLRQVVIEAKIVEVDLSHSFQYGIDWSAVSKSASGKFGITLSSSPNVQTTGNTGNIAFTLTGGSTQINAVLTALSTQGDVSVLSNETTTALNNQRAIFDVSTDEVFFSVTRTPLFGPTGAVVETQSSIIPQQISVGVVLDVLPQISADNILTMDIRPAVTSIDHVDSITTSDGTSASAPVIARREGDTIARLRAGETMIIGGLVQTRHDHTTSGIPVLSDLPLIGKAFQHIDNTESRSELVVFLTPTIVSGQPMAVPARPAGPGQ